MKKKCVMKKLVLPLVRLLHVLLTYNDIWAIFILRFWNKCKRNIKLHLEHKQHQIPKLLSTRKKPATETLTKFFASDKVTMTMTPNALKNTVDITVFNGNSLRFFSQPEVLARIGELARRLGVSRNRNNIKKLVLQMKSKRNNWTAS